MVSIVLIYVNGSDSITLLLRFDIGPFEYFKSRANKVYIDHTFLAHLLSRSHLTSAPLHLSLIPASGPESPSLTISTVTRLLSDRYEFLRHHRCRWQRFQHRVCHAGTSGANHCQHRQLECHRQHKQLLNLLLRVPGLPVRQQHLPFRPMPRQEWFVD
jgi:hypothetical protein